MKSIIGRSDQQHLVVIVSAMDKTTQWLEDICEEVLAHQDPGQKLEKLLEYHDQVLRDLNMNQFDFYCNLKSQLQSDLAVQVNKNPDQFKDHILGYGELLSSTVIHGFLQQDISIKWIDARDFVTTSNDYGEAKVNWDITSNKIESLENDLSESIIITQGYIGRDLDGNN
ncbi:MAG: hypothetical protein MI865_03250, partial [Proteobacteria bacterium]|nr:hypothetical protein [Pseudomonadota bacterium]